MFNVKWLRGISRTLDHPMRANEFHLLTFDPGAAATGWTHFCVDFRAFSRPEHKVVRNIKDWDCGEFTGPETKQLKAATALMDDTLGRTSYLTLDVLSEDFDLTQLVGGKNLLSPVRINAVLNWECQKRAIKFTLQRRQERTNVTRQRLKLWGFNGPFKKDEFAALQHAIVRLRKLKQQANRQPWKLGSVSALNTHWDCACAKNRRNKCDLVHP